MRMRRRRRRSAGEQRRSHHGNQALHHRASGAVDATAGDNVALLHIVGVLEGANEQQLAALVDGRVHGRAVGLRGESRSVRNLLACSPGDHVRERAGFGIPRL
jgi:hypothetical protein